MSKAAPLRDVAVVDISDEAGPSAVVAEAKKRFSRCVEWEGTSRERFINDIKFENGDSDNGYQWPNALRRAREVDLKPCLTMNLIRQHNLQISNAARKAKSTVKFMPQGNGATVESALVFQNVARRIELISNAQSAYTKARNFQIGGGIGWWRLATRYVSETSFDQDIFVLPVNDPLSIYMDPDIKQMDCSDAKFAFVFDNVPKEQFDEEFPELKGAEGEGAPLAIGSGDDWVQKDHVRVCEYFRKSAVDDLLISFVYQGRRQTILRSKLASNMLSIVDSPMAKTRPVQVERIEWFLIAGSRVIDSTVWVGKYIPLIRCLGEEVIVDGIMDRKGHTRAMKDAQRMFNYNSSAQVEFVAMQGKTPWVASAQAIEEYESMWNTANNVNHSVLVYNGIDDSGNPIAPPVRTQPPTAAPAYQAGMETAFNQIMMTSGQFQNQMGMMGNERTGAAIQKRQNQSETSVFHFQDNYEEALIYTGKQLLDLIPKVYDTARVLMIQAENEDDIELQIDPQAQQALQLERDAEGLVVSRIFNPAVGDYAVAPSVGPAYGSKREETSNALSLIITQSPQLTNVIGDLLLSSMDFDKAQEAAKRLRRMVPPVALGQGPTPDEQALLGQVEALKASLVASLQQQGKDSLKLVGKEQLRTIDTYRAETDRMKALSDVLPMDPQGLREVIRQLIGEALGNTLSPVVDANEDNLDIDTKEGEVGDNEPAGRSLDGTKPPLEGAKQAPDGHWYVENPAKPGSYLKALPNG